MKLNVVDDSEISEEPPGHCLTMRPFLRSRLLLLSAVLLLTLFIFKVPSYAVGFVPTETLRWGANSEGGVPFVLYDPDDSKKLIGFETEFAEELARRLKLKPEFVQNVWDILIPSMYRNLCDVVINGIEITPEHSEAVLFSIPYYVTYLQLVTHKGNPGNFSDLSSCRGHVIGTLRGSFAYDTLARAGVTQIRSYENEATAYQDMQNDRVEAVLMDAPMSIYYSAFNPVFEFVPGTIGRLEYGVAIRKSDKTLLEMVNKAIVSMRDDSTLRRIYDRWNLWNPLMAKDFQDFRPALEKPVMFEHWANIQKGIRSWEDRLKRYLGFMPSFGKAALMTLGVSVSSMILAMVLGLLVALCRLFGPAPLRAAAICWIEFIRGTPVMVQLFMIFYGLPKVGIQLMPFIAGTLALGINYSAYEAENYRAGLLSVPRSQMEGALALGMTKTQALRHVILPQAFRVTLLPLTNDFIALLKDSSLVSIITLVDLTRTYGQLATISYDYFGTGIIVAIIYLLLGLPFVKLARMLEAKLAKAIVGTRRGGIQRAASYRD